MEQIDLKIDWATYEASKYACKKWHYSKCVPIGKIVKIGVWENEKFIGVVLFSREANKDLLKPFSLEQTEGCELTRIALTNHISFVSQIIKHAIRFLKIKCPEMKLIVSFADKEQGHHGGIYQATNWIYTGETTPSEEYLYNNKRWHGRAFRKQHGSHLKYVKKGLKVIMGSSKHRYIMPLNKKIRKQILKLSKPYPKIQAC